jgi:hypothetical protein
VVGAVGVGFVAWPFLSTWNGLKKSPIGQKLDFANHPYLCKGLFKSILTTTFSICVSDFTCFIAFSKTVFCKTILLKIILFSHR